MENPHLTLEQRAYVVEMYFRTNSYVMVQQRFVNKFPGRTPPSKSSIKRTVDRFRDHFTLEDVPRSGRPRALTEEQRQGVVERAQEVPRISARRLAREAGFSRETVRRELQAAGLHPYRVSSSHELLAPDFAKRTEFCAWFKNNVADRVENLPIIFFSDEAWFHLSGYINSQNYRIWSAENPHAFQETSLHPLKVGVWCAVSPQRVVGPLFFDDTINAERYQEIMMQFIALLEQDERDAWFQQDGATAHTAATSISFLTEFFGERLISTGKWPARSPDLTPCDFFLWGYLKDKVYLNKPSSIDELKQEITAAINEITPEMLQNVFGNFFKRMNSCETAQGKHFQHLI